MRSKTVRHKSEHTIGDYIAIPRDSMRLHKYVVLVADVMFVNNIAILITMSRKIKFVTVEHIPTRTATQLSKSIKIVLRLYGRANMVVCSVLMDREFETISSLATLSSTSLLLRSISLTWKDVFNL